MTLEQLAEAGLGYDVSGAVATVTLSRPEVRNAQTPNMWRALAAIGNEVPDEIRVVVVRGEGRSFSADWTARCSTLPRRPTTRSRSRGCSHRATRRYPRPSSGSSRASRG